MMTPEEIQRTMDFILASQAKSEVRLDRMEENQAQLQEGHRLLMEGLKHQKETVDVLARMTRELLKAIDSLVDRTKRLETRSDSVDEIIRVLRELLEANLRRPDNPPKDKT